MKSLEYLNLALNRGFTIDANCSTVLWLNKVSDKNSEEFHKLLREGVNLGNTELMFIVNRLQDVVPADVISLWIRKLAADPNVAPVLCVYALRWTDYRKKVFFEEFIKTFADDPHYHLSQAMFTNGALDET